MGIPSSNYDLDIQEDVGDNVGNIEALLPPFGHVVALVASVFGLRPY